MATATDAKRLIVVSTPLGDGALQLYKFAGREEMSHLFLYHLDLISENDDIAPAEIVGKPITWEVIRQDFSRVYWNGVLSRFTAGVRLDGGTRTYKAEVVPWLWFLTLTSDCRIFQNKTVPQILEQVFQEAGFADYEIDCPGNHPSWDNCVQYRESSFHFVSRLMELEGVFHFFRHEDGKHVMVIADHKGAYKDGVDKDVDYTAVANPPESVLTAWDHQYSCRTGKWSQTDYNFEAPGGGTYEDLFKNENTLVRLPNNTNYEKYDYPGGYAVEGNAETKVRMEMEEAGYDVVKAAGDVATLKLGNKFAVRKHDTPSEAGKGYAITGIQHLATDDSYLQSGIKTDYKNSITAIPDDVVYRPALETPKPFVKGPQTAVVVGPPGEEIDVDKYGRVEVQFYWDREGRKDENSSTWLRVSEQWAGFRLPPADRPGSDRRFPRRRPGSADRHRAARDPEIGELLRDHRDVCQSLFDDEEAEKYAAYAPYLMSLTAGAKVVTLLVDLAWGKSWGVFLTCPRPFSELRLHLRGLLNAEAETGEILYFRYYDPRVLRVFLPTCLGQEAEQIFGPVKRFLAEGEAPGEWWQFVPREEGAARLPLLVARG